MNKAVAEMYRGTCDCGKWMMIPRERTIDNPYVCECGRIYYHNRNDYILHRKGGMKDFWDYIYELLRADVKSNKNPNIQEAIESACFVYFEWNRSEKKPSLDVPQALVFPQKVRDWEKEGMELEKLLDGLGDISNGSTLYEKTMSVINYYVNQMGRWVASNRRS